MLHAARDTLKIAGWAMLALAVTSIGAVVYLHNDPPFTDRAQLLALEIDIIKMVVVGFVVGVLGILIPATVTETRHRFEQRKESRAAYSEAKTNIDYLKLKLATMSLADATAALQKAHYHKHMAELFEEFPEWLKKRYEKEWEMTPDKWDEMMYGRLFGARRILEANAENWQQLSPSKRIILLDVALPTVSEAKKKPEA